MIRYHGGPITPTEVAVAVWTGRHALVSFFHPRQIALAAEMSQSFVIDNGAFSAWICRRSTNKTGPDPNPGAPFDFDGYSDFINTWHTHPGFDWCLIPDVIDGTEVDNDRMVSDWGFPDWMSVPVWHLHESLERLDRLIKRFPRVALGSSGKFAKLQTGGWWERMDEAMGVACKDGKPRCKLHGLRMMNPTIFSHIPFSSVDSSSVALNHPLDAKWDGPYQPLSQTMRAMVLADRFERHASAVSYSGSKGSQMNLELVG